MYSFLSRSRSLWVSAIVALALSLSGAHAFAMTFYVNSGLAELKPQDQIKISNPKPVQLLFQFQTKGTTNARATKLLRKKVTEAVQASGLFTLVSDSPTDGGAVLSVTINAVPGDGAAAKGFMTGLTFGLKGAVVSDNYLCTVDYIGGPDGTKITKTLQHAIYSTIGLTEPPPHSDKAVSGEEAIFTIVRQVISHSLNNLATNSGFNPSAVNGIAAASAPPEAVTSTLALSRTDPPAISEPPSSATPPSTDAMPPSVASPKP